MGEHKFNKPGRTGKFQDGKIDNTDDGELNIEISTRNGNVKMNFGKKITWLAMSPEDTLEFATILMRHAMILKSQRNTN